MDVRWVGFHPLAFFREDTKRNSSRLEWAANTCKKTNALAYFAGASATKKEDKSLKEVTPDFQSWVSA